MRRGSHFEGGGVKFIHVAKLHHEKNANKLAFLKMPFVAVCISQSFPFIASMDIVHLLIHFGMLEFHLNGSVNSLKVGILIIQISNTQLVP